MNTVIFKNLTLVCFFLLAWRRKMEEVAAKLVFRGRSPCVFPYAPSSHGDDFLAPLLGSSD